MLETEIRVTPQIVAEHGLSAEEHARMVKILGREPNFTELGIFSVMWSEHCSYKSSKVHLKRLPTGGPQVLQGPGENAGVVHIGDGLCAAFKIESHNHPSFVEPFQGAATGVGGILRDIFTMGARPIAVLDALRFGPITEGSGAGGSLASARDKQGSGKNEEETARNRRILDGVIRGIAFYGNCFGVPTVGGDVMFEPSYSHNPLVNVLALGIAKKDRLFYARARGVGNPVIYVGAKTGRDGIHGASLLASAEFTEESKQKRPNVQVADPFMEKLLLEACLEAMRTGAVVGIQDMGAAGLTCSTCEMGSRGGVGIEIELAKVPQRETGMTPYEIMLSESQERMLLVAERGREQEVLKVFAKWGLDAVEIGQVTGDAMLRVRDHGKVVAEIPAQPLAEEGPVYNRPMKAPEPRKDERLFEFAEERARQAAPDLNAEFRRLLASPAIASKRWIFEQYDHMVRTNTRVAPGAGDAAVLRIKGTRRALALSVDCNGRWCRLDPRRGAMHAVAEAARNVACAGAKPLAATNCLNFGNPEKPEIMWQFSQVIDGMAEACKALGVPITGGNVSFYNETLGKPIDPTPVIGVLGLMEDETRALGMAFRNEGDVIVLLDGSQPPTVNNSQLKTSLDAELSTLSPLRKEFSSSEYAKTIQGVVAGTPPAIDLPAEEKLIGTLVLLAAKGLIRSAHDISDGGIAVTLAECCFAATENLGAEVRLGGAYERRGQGPGAGDQGQTNTQPGAATAGSGFEPVEVALFGERGARVVVSCSSPSLVHVRDIARQYGVRALQIGRVTRGPEGSGQADFRIEYAGGIVVAAEVAALRDVWARALQKELGVRG